MKRDVQAISRAALFGLAVVVAGGCEKALFPEEMPRTQYERYDRRRGRAVTPEEVNAFGATRPALRERLSPYRP